MLGTLFEMRRGKYAKGAKVTQRLQSRRMEWQAAALAHQ